MAGKRKNYGAEFKAKVALEGMAGIFSGKAEAKAAAKEGEIEKLHAKIGQLVVGRDFLAKASGQ